jgi:hypothetical protein
MLARVRPLASDLQRIFGARLQTLVAYGDMEANPDGLHTLALVHQLTFQDLAGCVPLVTAWRKAGFAVPLMLTKEEFLRTLDVFPVEYGEIIARHVVLYGDDPFIGIEVSDADLRRACELQAKSHLIHLREGFLENGSQPAAVARMIAASTASLRALVTNLEPLDAGIADRAGLTPELMREVASGDVTTISDPSALLVRYMAAVERLWQQVDGWRG